jgi:glycosyltransferase involved in cell wall biosynthesis
MLAYNHEPYISRAVESVLGQRTIYPLELVIGEDCSTDGTREIVQACEARNPGRIRVVTSAANVGAKQNGLRALKACRGTYLAFCEGDDYWHHPLKVQKQVEYLECHPDCGLVYSSYDVRHVLSGKLIKDFMTARQRTLFGDPSVQDIVEGRGVPLTCTVLVRRALCQQIIEADHSLHADERFLMGDTQLWADFAAVSRLHYIPESLATHVITEESATRSGDVQKRLKFSISNAELHLYLCDKYGLPQQVRARHEAALRAGRLRLAFHARSRELADAVRVQKQQLTIEEWLLVYGARYSVVHYPLRLAAGVRRFLGMVNDPWA